MSVRRPGFVRVGFRRFGGLPTGSGVFPGFGPAAPPAVGPSTVGATGLAADAGHTHPFQHVANIAALAALAAGTMNDGSLVWVDSLKWPFYLATSALPTTPTTVIAASGAATKQWLRDLGYQSLFWQSQLTWSVDPSNSTGLASDQNTGINDAAPLLTHAECALRTWGAQPPTGTSMIVRHLSSDLAGAAAIYNVNGQGNAAGTDPNQISAVSSHFSIVGVPTVTYTGTVAAPVSTAAGAAGDNEFTDALRPAFSNATGVLWVRSSGVLMGFWPMKDQGANVMRHSCGTRTFNRLTLLAGQSWQSWTLPILRNVTFLTPNKSIFDTGIHNCDIRMSTSTGSPAGAYWHCDFTGSQPGVLTLLGLTAFGNCRNPFSPVANSTSAAAPAMTIGGGLVDAASQTLPAGSFLFGAPNTAYLSFQGRTFSVDFGVTMTEAQFSFYDNATDCLVVNKPTGRIHIFALGGSGNSAKLVNVTGRDSQVILTTVAAAASSDPSPFSVNAVAHATADLVDLRIFACCLLDGGVAGVLGGVTLAQAYNYGAVGGDQQLALTDARGGGVVIDGTNGGFTGAAVLTLNGTGGATVAYTRTTNAWQSTGAAFTTGTADANPYNLQTNGTIRQTFSTSGVTNYINTPFVGFNSGAAALVPANGTVMEHAAVSPNIVTAVGIVQAYKWDPSVVTWLAAGAAGGANGTGSYMYVGQPTYTSANAVNFGGQPVATLFIDGGPILGGAVLGLDTTTSYAIWLHDHNGDGTGTGSIRVDNIVYAQNFVVGINGAANMNFAVPAGNGIQWSYGTSASGVGGTQCIQMDGTAGTFKIGSLNFALQALSSTNANPLSLMLGKTTPAVGNINGQVWIPASAGNPTGNLGAAGGPFGGGAAMVYDKTNARLNLNDASGVGWRGIPFLTPTASGAGVALLNTAPAGIVSLSAKWEVGNDAAGVATYRPYYQ